MRSVNWRELRRKKHFWITVVVVVFALIEGGIIVNYVYQKQRQQQEAETYQVTKVSSKSLLTLSGRLAAQKLRNLTPTATTAKITKVNYADNSYVSAGDAVATVTDSSMKRRITRLQTKLMGINSQIAAQKAVIAAAKAEYNTAKSKAKPRLKTKVTTAKRDLVKLQAQATEVKTSLQQAKKQASYVIKAPCSGYLQVSQNSDGSYKVKISSSNLVVNGTVSEYDYATLSGASSSVTVTVAATGQKLSGKLVTVAKSSSSTSDGVAQYSYVVSVNSTKKALAGQTVSVDYYHAGFSVPKNSIMYQKVTTNYETHTYTYVYRVVNGVAKRTRVTVVRFQGKYYVTSGLKKGDTIISNLNSKLTKTQQKKVKIRE